jgi:hypothetical protein
VTVIGAMPSMASRFETQEDAINPEYVAALPGAASRPASRRTGGA